MTRLDEIYFQKDRAFRRNEVIVGGLSAAIRNDGWGDAGDGGGQRSSLFAVFMGGSQMHRGHS
jgi:hypothetical protein